MTNFERALYSDPEQDLDEVWWNLVERFQLLRRPPDRKEPDWAAKYHVALAPVYYQNYELGYLINVQFQQSLQREVGDLIGNKQAGSWLVERVFHTGDSLDWASHVEAVTGEALDMGCFVDSIKNGGSTVV
jgi:peptidyl-dipeptidase A